MAKYILKRFLGMIPTLLIIISISFFIMHVAPGGPFDGERSLPPAVMANIEAKYHLDEPVYKQYFRYIGDILKGDLGPSYRYKDHDVSFYIFTSLPNSLILGGVALLFAFLIGMLIGLFSALFQNGWPDYLGMSFAVIGISVPTFVVGPVLMYFLAMKLQILPTSGWFTDRNLGLETLLMPAVTLGFPYLANIARLSRASVLEVLRSDFIRTARAKGLNETVIMIKHVMKGALLPVVSYLGPAFAAIITGSVVIETIFRVPGLGKFFVQSSLNRDYTLILGVVIVYSVILILMNFIVDIIYSLLDPRVTYK